MTDQAERLDTGQIKPDSMTTTDRDDLYNQAVRAYGCLPVYSPGIRAVVDLVLAARPTPAERQPWDVLREAAHIYSENGGAHEWIPSNLKVFAARMVAEHLAAQEKAERDAEREKLIEQAARTMAAKHNPNTAWEDMSECTQGSFVEGARALADAGLLADPETTDGGAL